MIKQSFQRVNRAFLGLAFMSFLGFSDISFQDIETAIIREDYEQAKGLAVQWLSSGQDSEPKAEVQYYLALCDLRLGLIDQARGVFRKLSAQKDNETLRDKAYLGLFDTYYTEGDYETALEISKRLLQVNPRSEFLSLIYLKNARANLKLARWRKARGYLNKIVRQFPDSLEFHAAGQLLNEKQYFAVQVGAFINRSMAEQLMRELQQDGEYAYIVETVDEQDRTFFRVRVGQLARLQEAQMLKSKLSTAGYPTQIYP